MKSCTPVFVVPQLQRESGPCKGSCLGCQDLLDALKMLNKFKIVKIDWSETYWTSIAEVFSLTLFSSCFVFPRPCAWFFLVDWMSPVCLSLQYIFFNHTLGFWDAWTYFSVCEALVDDGSGVKWRVLSSRCALKIFIFSRQNIPSTVCAKSQITDLRHTSLFIS